MAVDKARNRNHGDPDVEFSMGAANALHGFGCCLREHFPLSSCRSPSALNGGVEVEDSLGA